jgi:uncharacterized membrane protein YfcA
MNDIINATFELLGGFFVSLSCLKLYHDKNVQGISHWQVAFFTCCGLWHLHFYATVDAWCSLVGGLGVTAANGTWLCMMLYYRSQRRCL